MIKNKISNKPWVQPVVSAVLAASLAVSPLTALAAMSLSPMAVFAAEPTTAQTSANSTDPQNNADRWNANAHAARPGRPADASLPHRWPAVLP